MLRYFQRPRLAAHGTRVFLVQCPSELEAFLASDGRRVLPLEHSMRALDLCAGEVEVQLVFRLTSHCDALVDRADKATAVVTDWRGTANERWPLGAGAAQTSPTDTEGLHCLLLSCFTQRRFSLLIRFLLCFLGLFGPILCLQFLDNRILR